MHRTGTSFPSAPSGKTLPPQHPRLLKLPPQVLQPLEAEEGSERLPRGGHCPGLRSAPPSHPAFPRRWVAFEITGGSGQKSSRGRTACSSLRGAPRGPRRCSGLCPGGPVAPSRLPTQPRRSPPVPRRGFARCGGSSPLGNAGLHPPGHVAGGRREGSAVNPWLGKCLGGRPETGVAGERGGRGEKARHDKTQKQTQKGPPKYPEQNKPCPQDAAVPRGW